MQHVQAEQLYSDNNVHTPIVAFRNSFKNTIKKYFLSNIPNVEYCKKPIEFGWCLFQVGFLCLMVY